jgi:hypothetical protein
VSEAARGLFAFPAKPWSNQRQKLAPLWRTATPNNEHNQRMNLPDSKYLMDTPACSEHHGREWPTNKTTNICLSAIDLQ